LSRLDSEVAQVIFQNMLRLSKLGALSKFISPKLSWRATWCGYWKKNGATSVPDTYLSVRTSIVFPNTPLDTPGNPVSQPTHDFGLSVFSFGRVKTTTVLEISSVHILLHGPSRLNGIS
jgi:hypothetical protein